MNNPQSTPGLPPSTAQGPSPGVEQPAADPGRPATHLPQHPEQDDDALEPGQEHAIQPDDRGREDPDLQHESAV